MILWTALLLGLVGSLHCAGMCGPLALALPTSCHSTSGFVAGRLAYNLGRVATYCLLGVIFGLAGRTLLLAGIQRWVSIGLGVALFVGLFSSRPLALWSPVIALVGRLKSGMGRLLRCRSIVSLGLLGLLNGFLPCGLVYVACAGALAAGGLLAGVQYIAMFGLGTVPMMLGISLSGRLLSTPLRLQVKKAIPASVFVLATLLILRGMSLGIPYVSPNLNSHAPACCSGK
jgi:sulfite exporter TauE/SafE